MKINIMAEGNDTPEERAIIMPAFEHILSHLLENEKIQPWMTVVILANTLIACIMQMEKDDQVNMLEYFSETTRMAWISNRAREELEEQGVGRPH